MKQAIRFSSLLTTNFLIAVFFHVFVINILWAKDRDYAPASFMHKNHPAVFVDFQHVKKHFLYDVAKKKAFGSAIITFDVWEEGLPVLIARPKITSLQINQIALDLSMISTRKDPENKTPLTVIEHVLPVGTHSMSIEFELTNENLSFGSNYVRSAFFMSDLEEVPEGFGLIERYAPTNFEFDRYSQEIHYEVRGTTRQHELISNGTRIFKGRNEWRYRYPEYYAPGSLYMHLFEDGHFVIKAADFDGLKKRIPVTSYAATTALADSGLKASLHVLKELENTYGPYLHEQAIAYITESGGGMEHAGATITSLWALEHEFTHFWFARGVMPVDGNSGWIDEAIASWRDDDYPRYNPRISRNPVNLAGYSQYRRSTPRTSYTLGSRFMSELDYYFSLQGLGLKEILAELFQTYAGQGISTPVFRDFIEQRLDIDVSPRFDRYVYGQDVSDEHTQIQSFSGSNAPEAMYSNRSSRHPRPFTPKELKDLL